MSEYKLSVPNGANDFTYGNQTYGAGSTFETDDPCAAIAFYDAARTSNPEIGRRDITRNFWANVDAACQTRRAAAPPQPVQAPPVEARPNPAEGDTPNQQGAPQPPASGTVTGGTNPAGGPGPNPAPEEEPTRPPQGEPHPQRSGERPQETTSSGDPIDLFSGLLTIRETDLEIPNTITPLSLTRHYRSGAASFGPLGWNWDHNHNLFLRELTTGNIALWRNLHEDLFIFDGASFQPPRGVFERLERLPGPAASYEITGRGGTVMRFERPAGWIDAERIPIVWFRDRHGNSLQYSYDAGGRLAAVSDDDGRAIRFEYNPCDLLLSVFDNSGRRYRYAYAEETRHLVCVTAPATADHPDGSTRIFHYDHAFAPPELRHNIVRIEDNEGNVYLQNAYEQDPASWQYGRVTEQLYGGFQFQFCYTQLQWVPADPLFINIPSVQAVVVNPDFGLETYTFNYRGDLLDRRFRLQKDRSYRVVAWQYEYDEQGNPAVITRPDGSRETSTYDAGNSDPCMRGNLLRKELSAATGYPAPSRIIWRASYEPAYQLITEERNEQGASTRYRYDFDLAPGAPGNTGKLREVIHPDATLPDGTMQGSSSGFEHNAKGQVTARIGPDGVRNELHYGNTGNAKSRLVKEVFDTAGLAIENTVAYDAVGFATEFRDGNNNPSSRVMNALGLVEKIALAPVNGRVAEYRLHYNADRRVASMERPKGEYADAVLTDTHIIDRIERDVLGYPTRYVLSSNTAEARTTRLCPDFRGYPLEIANPDGSRVVRAYDERGLLNTEEVIGKDGTRRRTKKTYNRAGKLTRETDAAGLVTQYEYDGFSRLRKISLPNGSDLLYTWLPGDLLASEEVIGEDGSGNRRQLSKKQYAYDEKGRRVAVTAKVYRDDPATAADVTTTYFHDQADRLVKAMDVRGGSTTYTYDGLGRIAVQTDPQGNEQRYSYDGNGNLIKIERHERETDGTIAVISQEYLYDERNRKTANVAPDGAAFAFQYDDRNLVTRHVDPRGVATEAAYNSFHDRISETQDAGGLSLTQRWTVDVMSRVTSYTDPAGQTSRYHIDGIGRVFRMEYPNGFSSERSFDARGLVATETLASGVKFEYGYDAALRLASIDNTVVPPSLSPLAPHAFAYDGLNRVVTATAGADTVARSYDSTGRLTAEQTNGLAIACRYDDAAGIMEKTWPDGRSERYAHDLNGILSSVEESAPGTLGAGAGMLASLTPSGANHLGEMSGRGGLKISHRYDERKRPVEIAIKSAAGIDEQVQYRYDRTNRRQVEAITGLPNRISYFEFDARSRLTLARDGFSAILPAARTQAEHDAVIAAVQAAAAAAPHEESFTYTPADARSQHQETGTVTMNYTYLTGHRIASDGANAYSHTADGMLEDDSHFTYKADALGRIVEVRSATGPVCAIAYDAFGRPRALKETGQPDRSLYYLGGFVEQENENDVAARQFTRLPGTGVPIAYHTAGATRYTLFDSRSNLIGLADSAGTLLETYRYRPFGVPEVYDASGNARTASAFGVEPVFGGQRHLNCGLYLSTRRLMNPVHGLYLTPDPKGYLDSPALYVYAAQDPINNIDPEGEVVPLIVAAFVIGGALAGAGYSAYSAYRRPEEYEGWQGSLRVLGNVFGGALIGGVAVVAGEAVLAVGGTGLFATGAGAASGTSLTALQSFALYGTSSAVSGTVLRGGFNTLFPEEIDPVSARTVTVDFVAGGALGTAFRALTNYVTSPGFGTFSSIPGSGRFSQWLRFGADAGGEEVISGSLGAYPGRIGAWLNRIGIRQGYNSSVVNHDLGTGNVFAAVDTGVHEGFHALVSRYLPTFKNLSAPGSLAAIGRYPEEVVAYALGHGAAGRIHGMPFAPFEALNSLVASGYSAAEIAAARIFWSRLAGATGVFAAEQLSSDEGRQNQVASK